ncbi:MAG: pilus assembly protein PilM [Planctomycetota bacterium]
MADLPVWGIHITTASIRGVKIVRDGGDMRIVAHDQVDFAEDIDDIESLERHGALAHALFVFAKRHDLSKSRVVISVDASTAFNRYVETPMVEGESMMRLLEYEAQQQIPFDLDGVHWGHKVLNLDHDANIAHIMLFAIKKEVVDERLRRMAKVRFPVDQVQISPIALFNYAAYEGLAKDGYALISVDYDRSDVVISHRGRFWFRSLPTGVFSYVEAIRESIEPRHRAAVRIGRGEVKPEDPKAFKEVRDAYTERLASELSRMIEYYRGTLRDVDLKGIVLLPASRLVPSIGSYLKEATGLEVYAVKSFRKLKIDPGIVTPEIERHTASFAHAAGLALQGHNEAEVDVKLYDPSIERDIGVRKVFYALSIFGVFALVGWLWWQSSKRVEQLNSAQKALLDQVGQADAQTQKFEKHRRELDISDELAPYQSASRGREAALKAVEDVLAAIEAEAAPKGPDDRTYLLRIETKPADFAEGRALGRRRVQLRLGRLDRPGVDSAAAIMSGVIARLKSNGRVSDVIEKNRYQAPSLMGLPMSESVGKTKILRRRFTVIDYQFVYKAPEPAVKAPESAVKTAEPAGSVERGAGS